MKPQQQANIAIRMAQAHIAKEADKIRLQVIQQMYAVSMVVLSDKFNFKAEDLIKYFTEATKQFECVGDKYVKIEDFYELLEGMGIKVR